MALGLTLGVLAVPTTKAAPLPPDYSRCVAVPGAAAGDVAVINITNTQAKARGFGALRSSSATPIYSRAADDQYSSVNFAPNAPPNPNLAFSPVGTNGEVCYDGANAQHNTILDLAAVIPKSVTGATSPTRVLDTRRGVAVGSNASRCVSVPGAAAGDVAVVNITNTQATGRGYGALRSSDATPIYSRPSADQYSSVNFAPNTPPNPNLAVAAVGPDGKICYDGAAARHHTILDLTAVAPASSIPAVDPVRILDTRSAPGSVTESQIKNQTLPAGTCGWVGDNLGRVMRNGVIRSPLPLGGEISIGTIVYTDFDGNGLDDAAYLVTCWGGGNSIFSDVAIHMAGRRPVIFDQGELYTTSQMSTANGVDGIVKLELTASGQSVRVDWLGYTPFDANCCPSLDYVTYFRASPEPRISSTFELDGDGRVIATGDSRCSAVLMNRHVDADVRINEQLCLDGWAYIDFCFDGECGLGDASAILRYTNSQWDVYTYFPNFALCESTVRADGMPSRIVNRINWAC